MKVAELRNALKSIRPDSYKTAYFSNVFFYKEKQKEKVKLIGVHYNSYSPKFTFHAMTVGIKFTKVESTFIPIYKKHIHPTANNDDYNKTFTERIADYTDDLIYQGVTYKAELDKLIQQTEEIITTKALDWFEQYDKLEDVADYLRDIDMTKATVCLGGFHGLFRRIIIMHLVNDVESFVKFIKETENVVQENIDVNFHMKNYIPMLEEIKQLRTV